jgi:polysaccharide biosynthesis/export protein
LKKHRIEIIQAFSFALLVVLLMGTPNLVLASGDEYIIEAKDELMIALWGEEGFSSEVVVSEDGTVPFFYLGEVKVAGLTVGQARKHIAEKLADGFIKEPVVNLRVSAYKSKRVVIHGELVNPGTYLLETNTTTLFNLISIAGGTTQKRGDIAKIFRANPAKDNGDSGSAAHKDKNNKLPLSGVEVVDLHALLDGGDLTKDVIIYPGDFVIIGKKTAVDYIYVGGEVQNPKEIEYEEGLTASHAITRAGGFNDLAAPNRTIVLRTLADGTIQRVRVRLKDVEKGKTPDFPLKPGDRINVKQSIF